MIDFPRDLSSDRASTADQAVVWRSTARRWVEYLTFIGLFVALPFGWVSLGVVGGLVVRPLHVAIAVLTLVHLRYLRWYRPFSDATFRAYSIAYAGYLVAMTLSVLWTNDKYEAIAAVAKIFAHFVAFLILTQIITCSSQRKLAYASKIGGAVGILAFVFVCSYIFAQYGRNLLVEYSAAIASGDADTLQYAFYGVIFNQQDATVEATTTLRNTVMGSFMLILIATLYYRQPSGGRFLGLCHLFICVTAPVIVLASVSRSNMLSLALVVCFAYVAYAVRHVASMSRLAVAPVLLLLMGTIGTFLFPDEAAAIAGAVQERFVSIQSDPRVHMYSRGLEAAGESWSSGVGVGATFEGKRIHNLPLASLFEGGIVAFGFSCAFYLIVTATWIYALLFSSRLRAPGAHWLVAFPVVPLLRAMVSGEGGNFTLVETLCLAFFFAECLRCSLLAEARTAPKQLRQRSFIRNTDGVSYAS